MRGQPGLLRGKVLAVWWRRPAMLWRNVRRTMVLQCRDLHARVGPTGGTTSARELRRLCSPMLRGQLSAAVVVSRRSLQRRSIGVTPLCHWDRSWRAPSIQDVHVEGIAEDEAAQAS